MDLSELTAPLNLSFNMALFCLGVFIRVDTTLAMVTTVSQTRIALTKKLAQLEKDVSMSELKKEEQKEDAIRRLDTIERQLLAHAYRLFVQKLTIWLALGGCLGLATCGFFLMLCLYEPLLYFVVLVAFIISNIIMFAAGVCGFMEVGVTHKAELIMIEYLKDKELETFESDDEDDVVKKDQRLHIENFDSSSDEKLHKIKAWPRRKKSGDTSDSDSSDKGKEKDKTELIIREITRDKENTLEMIKTRGPEVKSTGDEEKRSEIIRSTRGEEKRPEIITGGEEKRRSMKKSPRGEEKRRSMKKSTRGEEKRPEIIISTRGEEKRPEITTSTRGEEKRPEIITGGEEKRRSMKKSTREKEKREEILGEDASQ